MRYITCRTMHGTVHSHLISSAINERVVIKSTPDSDESPSEEIYLSPSEAVELAKQLLNAAKTASNRTLRSINKLSN